MILNANIPLNTTSPARQYSWRVGVFLGIFLLSFGLSWTITKHLFTGILAPQLTTPSGLTLRITPENALWLNKQTAGLTISDSCPLDLPTLISFKKPSWIVLGDTGAKEEIFFTGKLPEKLKNYKVAFSCPIVQTEQGFFLSETTSQISFTLPLTAPDGWIWVNENQNPLKLNDHGISISMAISKNTKIPIPQESLTSALPIPKISFNIFSRQWEGLNNLFEAKNGVAFFSWAKQEETAFGLVVAGELSDKDIIALAYDLANIPTNSQKTLRKDEVSYNTTTRDELSVITLNNTQKEIQLSNGTSVAFIVLQNGFSLFSTAQTTWESNTHHWKAELFSNKESKQHTSQTLASFGEKIFTTKNTVNILNK